MSTKKQYSRLDLCDELNQIIDQVELLALALQAQTLAEALHDKAHSGLCWCVQNISDRLQGVSEYLEERGAAL